MEYKLYLKLQWIKGEAIFYQCSENWGRSMAAVTDFNDKSHITYPVQLAINPVTAETPLVSTSFDGFLVYTILSVLNDNIYLKYGDKSIPPFWQKAIAFCDSNWSVAVLYFINNRQR